MQNIRKLKTWNGSLKGDYAVVDFNWDGGEHSAWFNPLSAAWYMTETDVRYENLPEPILTAHKASKYADWRVDDVDKLTREGMETLYVIEVEKGESEPGFVLFVYRHIGKNCCRYRIRRRL